MKSNGENFECHLVPSSFATFGDKIHNRKVLLEFKKDNVKRGNSRRH